MAEKQLAVISEVGIGMRDNNFPCLWFTVHLSESEAALKVFPWEEAGEIIEDYGVRDAHDLDGKACWVEVADRIVMYVGAFKAAR